MDLTLVDGVFPLKSGEPDDTLNADLRQELLHHRPGGGSPTSD